MGGSGITFYALIAVAFVWVLWNKTRFGKTFCYWRRQPGGGEVSQRKRGAEPADDLCTLSGVFYAFGGLRKQGVLVSHQQPRLYV